MKKEAKTKVLFFFVDGYGIGEESEFNLISQNKILSSINEYLLYYKKDDTPKLIEGDYFICNPIDACLGVNGIPQSATGQSALLSGINTSEILGFHLNAYPNKRIIDILNEKSILKTLKEMDIR